MMAGMAADAGQPPAEIPVVTDLESVYREHYRSLVRLASLLIDDVETCEELVQDAFVAVWRRPGAVDDPAKLPAYLRSAVLNGARSVLRRRRVARRHLTAVPLSAPGADVTALARGADPSVLLALRSLPDRQREVLVLRYYLDLSEAEIAETLGLSPGSVKTHAHRGLAAMSDRLEERG
jgi:RNA polymerase sigma-70 factor (sigma-E family)